MDVDSYISHYQIKSDPYSTFGQISLFSLITLIRLPCDVDGTAVIFPFGIKDDVTLPTPAPLDIVCAVIDVTCRSLYVYIKIIYCNINFTHTIETNILLHYLFIYSHC